MPRKAKVQDKEVEKDEKPENTTEETANEENDEVNEKETTKENRSEGSESEKVPEKADSENSEDEKQDEDSSSETGDSQPVTATPAAPSSTIEKPPSTADSTLKFFVGGLHPNTDEAELSSYFSKYGQILATQVMRDLTTGRHRGFGFVTIKVQPNSMSVFKDNHTVTGKRIDVRAMQTDVAAGLRKKIFVGGLSKALNEEMLEEYFSKFGEVEKVTIMRQLDGTSRGFGFIVFSTDEAASGALKNPTHFVYGNKVDVRAAETRTKTPPPAPVNVVYPYGVMQAPTADVYSHASPMYRPQTTYDPNQYANMTQQQMLQQYPQYQLLQQQMVQQQMAMAGTYGNYYGATGQQTPGAATAAPAATAPTTNPYTAASVSYGPYRGKTDPVYQSGPTNDPTSSRGSYRQQPY